MFQIMSLHTCHGQGKRVPVACIAERFSAEFLARINNTVQKIDKVDLHQLSVCESKKYLQKQRRNCN